MNFCCPIFNYLLSDGYKNYGNWEFKIMNSNGWEPPLGPETELKAAIRQG